VGFDLIQVEEIIHVTMSVKNAYLVVKLCCMIRFKVIKNIAWTVS